MDKPANMGWFYLKGLQDKTKTRINVNEHKTLYIPQYEGLDKQDLLDWAKEKPDAMKALPDSPREQKLLHKDFIANVIYT